MISMTTMIRAAVLMFGLIGTACGADHRGMPDAGDCVPAATIKGSSVDARRIMHTLDLSNAAAAYALGELSFTDPTRQQLQGAGFHLGTHCNGSVCQPTGPGSYGVGWSVCWEDSCHGASAGEGEFLNFDRLDDSCVAGSFHLVGGPTSGIPGDFTGTFAIPR